MWAIKIFPTVEICNYFLFFLARLVETETCLRHVLPPFFIYLFTTIISRSSISIFFFNNCRFTFFVPKLFSLTLLLIEAFFYFCRLNIWKEDE